MYINPQPHEDCSSLHPPPPSRSSLHPPPHSCSPGDRLAPLRRLLRRPLRPLFRRLPSPPVITFFSLLTAAIQFVQETVCDVATMLTIHPPKGISKCCIHGNTTLFQQVPPSSITPINFLTNIVVVEANMRVLCNQKIRKSFYSGECFSRFRISNLSSRPNRSALKRCLCRSHNSDILDDEFRSSRNIAISLFRRYKNVINRGGGDNLKDFISAGVNAYALGCTDEGLKKELLDMKDTFVDIDGIETYGGTTSLKAKILSTEVDECILWLCIIFITILCTPQPTVVRWSSTSPVSNEIMLQWKGFCALIANAYYIKGMAWLPVKTLQLEQMAVMGCAEEPSVVASRMQLVFTTLEVVSPQWPKV